MADSNLTKRALAEAMKELMNEVPFSKISVSDICERCHMNRKSFYYHFRDKYDLVNWIFDTEASEALRQSGGLESLDAMSVLCHHFYSNHQFYRRALEVQGQNSLTEHFRELFVPILERSLKETMGADRVTSFHVDFFADAVICAIRRWLVQKNCLPPEEFLDVLFSCIGYVSSKYGDRDEMQIKPDR